MAEQADGTTNFGFKDVPKGEKEGLVRAVFDSVAHNYDLMNDLMSGGVHRIWKSVLLDRLDPQPGQKLIDVAGGTGDIAIGFLARAEARPLRDRAPARATVCDINHAMMVAGIQRADAKKFEHQLTRLCGNAEELPARDNSFDRYTIGFGIRNVTDRDRALAEAYRVLKRGGRFVCLEFSHAITESLQKAYDRYSFKVIPKLGEWVAQDRDSYQYLVESIRRFPTQDQFGEQIKAAGFEKVSYENLSGGIAALHYGWKL